MTRTRRSREFTGTWLAVFVLAVAIAGGCAPELDPEQYGTVVTELPKVESADEPYPLPELEESPGEPAADTTPAEK